MSFDLVLDALLDLSLVFLILPLCVFDVSIYILLAIFHFFPFFLFLLLGPCCLISVAKFIYPINEASNVLALSQKKKRNIIPAKSFEVFPYKLKMYVHWPKCLAFNKKEIKVRGTREAIVPFLQKGIIGI